MRKICKINLTKIKLNKDKLASARKIKIITKQNKTRKKKKKVTRNLED